MIQFADRIYIANNSGTVASAIERQLLCQGYSKEQLIVSPDLDLCNQRLVDEFFIQERPDQVYFPSTALDRNDSPEHCLHRELASTTHVLNSAFRTDVKKLLFIASATVYPRHALQPISEEELSGGPSIPETASFEIAQLAGIKLCESYNSYQEPNPTDFRCAVVCQEYDLIDNQSTGTPKLVENLIRKISSAITSGDLFLMLPGSGSSRVELMYVDDIAESCVHLLDLPKAILSRHIQPQRSHINVGSGMDISIQELANTLAKMLGYTGYIVFESSNARDESRLLLDSHRANALGCSPLLDLEEGLYRVCRDFKMKNSTGNRPLQTSGMPLSITNSHQKFGSYSAKRF